MQRNLRWLYPCYAARYPKHASRSDVEISPVVSHGGLKAWNLITGRGSGRDRSRLWAFVGANRQLQNCGYVAFCKSIFGCGQGRHLREANLPKQAWRLHVSFLQRLAPSSRLANTVTECGVDDFGGVPRLIPLRCSSCWASSRWASTIPTRCACSNL